MDTWPMDNTKTSERTSYRSGDAEFYRQVRQQICAVPMEDRQLFTQMYFEYRGLKIVKQRSDTSERSNPHILRSEP